jgi:membrane associated rhomboid family serine protease
VAETAGPEAPQTTGPPPEEEIFRELDPSPAGPGSDAKAAAATCALVLASRGIPHRLQAAPPRVEVPEHQLSAASRELDLFAAENRDWPPAVRAPLRQADNTYLTLTVLALLALFHALVHGGLAAFGLPPVDWLGRGSAAAGRILAGEWWRPITALTLHADTLHLLSNLLLGAPLVVVLCRRLGSGLGWSLVLASGALGNLTNALLQNAGHLSIGSSTALFGTLGLLAGLGLFRGRLLRLRRWMLPLAAALALLALLGTGRENVDVEAHLFGFFWGVLLGLAAGFEVERRGVPGAGFCRLLGAGAGLLLLAGWWAALTAG